MSATKNKRQPAQLEMAGGKGSRQLAWEAIRKFGKPFKTNDLVRKTGTNEDTLLTYLRSLVSGGYLSTTTQPSYANRQERVWTLIKDNGMEAPRLTRDGKPVTQGLGTEAMWRSMRIVGDFNHRELAAHASAGQTAVSEGAAKAYALMLLAAGYLIVVKPATGGRAAQPARYRLMPGKFTGPRPPMIQRTKTVYDPNLNKVVYQEPEKNHDDL